MLIFADSPPFPAFFLQQNTFYNSIIQSSTLFCPLLAVFLCIYICLLTLDGYCKSFFDSKQDLIKGLEVNEREKLK